MAKEKEKEVTLIDAFKDFKEEKNIDRAVMLGVLKDVFLTQISKTYGSANNSNSRYSFGVSPAFRLA